MISALSSTQAISPQDAAKHRKLVDAAQQFEAVFLNEMLKGSFQSQDGESDGDESSGQNGTIQGMGLESVSKAIAQAGGFGIARHIVAEVEHEHTQQQASQKSETALKSSTDTPMKPL